MRVVNRFHTKSAPTTHYLHAYKFHIALAKHKHCSTKVFTYASQFNCRNTTTKTEQKSRSSDQNAIYSLYGCLFSSFLTYFLPSSHTDHGRGFTLRVD